MGVGPVGHEQLLRGGDDVIGGADDVPGGDRFPGRDSGFVRERADRQWALGCGERFAFAGREPVCEASREQALLDVGIDVGGRETSTNGIWRTSVGA